MTRCVRYLAASVVLLALTTVSGVAARAQSPKVDDAASRKLTDYFRTHRLPLVGAQVTDDPAGRHVMLYGFVATQFGKTDAEHKARDFLKHAEVRIDNRIEVRPEIRHLKPRKAPASSDETPDQSNER